MGWIMPAETAEQERLWMAFPSGDYTLGDTPDEAHAARTAWAAVANAAVEFEPVTMVIAPGDEAVTREYLSPDVETRTAPLNDAWMRDIGPTFVHDDDGRLGAVNWVFNGWGQQEWAHWDKDQHIGAAVAGWADVELIDSPMVNEGGGLQVDGEGTVLVTETVQLDPYRNPGLTKADVEAELARTIGATHVIWLPRGLTRDAQTFGTRGHVDIVAAIPSPGVLLVHSQQNPDHPDYQISRDLIEYLSTTHDAAGRSWDIVPVPAPETLSDDEGFVDYSYINHVVINGAVIACSFGDPADEQALSILRDVYPRRQVLGLDARELFARGGGIHCITQQQPREVR